MRYLFTSLLFLTINLIFGQAKYTKILKSIQENKSVYTTVAHQIWSYAEMGYQEEQSSALLQKILKSEGFDITTGVAEIPTAFVASYGSAKEEFIKKRGVDFIYTPMLGDRKPALNYRN